MLIYIYIYITLQLGLIKSRYVMQKNIKVRCCLLKLTFFDGKKDGKMLHLWAMTGWTRPEVIP